MKNIIVTSFLLIVFLFMSCIPGNRQNINDGFTLVCLADSLTAGHGATTPGEDNFDKSFPSFLQKKVSIPVINAGVTGNTTIQGLVRVNDDVISRNPKIVVIGLGANDFFQNIPLSTTKENLQNIISMVNNESRKIYLAKFYTEAIAREMITMFDINDYDEQTSINNQYNELFYSLATSNNIELREDIWDGVWGIHMSDHIHPDEHGYKIMAENIFKVLKPYLQENNKLCSK
jgi:acyl-CoA thioesterase-1